MGDEQGDKPFENIKVEIDVPDTPISLQISSSEYNVLVLWVTGLKHPDITAEDFDQCGYFGPASKDARLEGAVSRINDVLLQWEQKIMDEEEAQVAPSASRSGFSNIVSNVSEVVSKLFGQWEEAAPPPKLEDYFYLTELKDATVDIKAAGISAKTSPNNVPSGLREKFDIAELVEDLRQAVPEIRSAALEGLKVQTMGNARENYFFMASNALKTIGEDIEGVDLRLREAEINARIGRPLPKGVTYEGD